MMGTVLLWGLVWSANSARAGIVPGELGEMKTGVSRYRAGEYEEALTAFESALVRAPESPAIGLAVGETLFQLERYEEAANEFQRVLDLTNCSSWIFFTIDSGPAFLI